MILIGNTSNVGFFRSFPVNYWDKFVKKKVRQKYSETYDFESISNLLGMEKTSFQQQDADEKKSIISLLVFYICNLKIEPSRLVYGVSFDTLSTEESGLANEVR